MNKIILGGIFLLFLSCGNKTSKIETPKEEKVISHRNNFDWLCGKEIHSIDSVIKALDKKKKIVYLFNLYDCETCVDAGFSF